jgi:L-lysine exporter family protein LysE/ArgO
VWFSYSKNKTVLSTMSAFISGFSLSLSLIAAIGPQNAHVLRMGLGRQPNQLVFLTVVACALTDLILIAIGVMGFAKISELSPLVHKGLLIGATLFLLHYGWQAFKRAWRGVGAGLQAQSAQLPTTAKQAILVALAFSWLNPHAWLDTAVLIGSASLLHGAPNNYVFGAGAALGSTVWFVTLAWVATRLAKHLQSPLVWRGIDALVALTMWGTAVWLILTSFGPMAVK